MGVEFELKYAITGEILEDVCREFPGQWKQITMETTYYDTPSGSLSARRYTLRTRLENGVSVCTVKTPAQDGSRGEWEITETHMEAAIPMLCKLGAPEDLLLLTQEGIVPVCGARFTRLAQSVPAEDAVIELALDRGILFAGDAQIPLCELEAELKSGSRETAVAFAKSLAQKYALQPEPKSKFRRALDLNKER